MSVLKWLFENALSIIAAVSGLSSVAMIVLSSKFATRSGVRKAHGAIYQRLDNQGDRILKIEGTITGLATKQDINAVLVALERQDGDRKALSEKVEGVKNELSAISRPLGLIHEYLLNRDKR